MTSGLHLTFLMVVIITPRYIPRKTITLQANSAGLTEIVKPSIFYFLPNYQLSVQAIY